MMTHRDRALALALALAASGPALGSDFKAKPLEPDSTLVADAFKVRKAGMVSLIVKLDAQSVASYDGGIPGLAATSPRLSGTKRLDLKAPGVVAYRQYFAQKRQAFEAAAAAAIPAARVTHTYDIVFGGVAMVVPANQVEAVAKLPGVTAVYADELRALDTDRSPVIINAARLWEKLGGQSQAGAGLIVGIIDTGVWPEHPSLDPAGFPPPPPTWAGTVCEFGSSTPGDVPFACNNKLIGADRHMDTFDNFGPDPLPGEFFSARDNNGHGSHTMTTAAGNANVDASFLGGPPIAQVTGIAPAAHVVSYKVCFTIATGQGSCFTSDSASAIQQAILDGVNVLNFSIAGGTNPYSDVVELAFLDAYAAGVFVAASAGNTGPGANTVAHRGPWVTTVGASTTDRNFEGSASLTADGGGALTVTGTSLMPPISSPAPVVLSSDPPYSDTLCLNPAAPGTLTGKIAICQRGINARIAKGFNVQQGGAVGMILYNPSLNTLNADVHFLPAVHIDHIQGAALVAFMGASANEQGTFSGGAPVLNGQADVMAAFSSRGGSGQTLGITKPDVTAPGVNILAGQTPLPAAVGTAVPGELFQVISGTSMSSPHVAGTAALLMQLHPTWTPGQIKSAIMTTSDFEGIFKENGVTRGDPFDFGSGRINLGEAGNAVLTFDASAADYFNNAGNLSVVNYPSLYIPVMPGRVQVQRTVRSHLGTSSTWKISVSQPDDIDIDVPKNIVVPAGGTTSFTMTVDASGLALGSVRHARLELRNAQLKRDLTFPITIVAQQGAATLSKTCTPDTLSKGSTTDCTITTANTSFSTANITITDNLPKPLKLTHVDGATQLGPRLLSFSGALAAAQPPDVTIGTGTSPAGYLPLSLFGVAPIPGVGDETIVNLGVPAFIFAGNTYTSIGMVSDGYAVVGGGSGPDVQFLNQNMPDTARPNNTLAPFWSDLNPATGPSGSGLRAATLTDGVNTWIVLDWEDVPNFGDGELNSFQIWIGINGVEDITYTFGSTLSDGDNSLLTTGAENLFGNRGANYYYNGAGTLPAFGTDLRVTGTPSVPGGSHTINFRAQGVSVGAWTNCAEMTADIVFGTTISCFSGSVTP